MIAPYFFNHYLPFVDKFKIIIDSDSDISMTKLVQEYQKKYPEKINIEWHMFPDMLDDELKSKTLSFRANISTCDWVMIVDSDEFVFSDVKNKIQTESGNIIMANFHHPYKNINDKNLDPNILPIIEQRRYGTKILETNGIKCAESLYIKPIIYKPEIKLIFNPGNHSYNLNSLANHKGTQVKGSHWIMADPELAIERRVNGRKNRQSKRNIEKGYTIQHWTITPEIIKKECETHLNDGQLF
jgi:hypothetical protein